MKEGEKKANSQIEKLAKYNREMDQRPNNLNDDKKRGEQSRKKMVCICLVERKWETKIASCLTKNFLPNQKRRLMIHIPSSLHLQINGMLQSMDNEKKLPLCWAKHFGFGGDFCVLMDYRAGLLCEPL